MNYEEELEKLWKIRKTVLQMVNDRGYIVTHDELEQPFDQFKETFGERLNSNGELNRSKLIILVSHNDDSSDELYVFFPDEQKVFD